MIPLDVDNGAIFKPHTYSAGFKELLRYVYIKRYGSDQCQGCSQYIKKSGYKMACAAISSADKPFFWSKKGVLKNFLPFEIEELKTNDVIFDGVQEYINEVEKTYKEIHMLSEKSSYRALKKALESTVEHFRIDRVENRCISGMPDISLCIGGSDVWIELKCPKEPKRENTPLFGSAHKISVHQRNWMRRHLDAWGSAYYLISTKSKWILMHPETENIDKLSLKEMCEASVWYSDKPIKDPQKWVEFSEIVSCKRILVPGGK